ncbi:MAG: HAD family hydrolase [Planctomycetaceae bacterium]|nr:HAD family hydrolase [Planctomycetaceae bacterium]
MRSLAFSISLPIPPVTRLKQPIEGLLLDTCNVLYDATGWRRWLLQVLRRFGLHSHYRSLFHVWEKDYLRPVFRGQCDFCHALRTFLQALGLSPGQIEEVAAACQTRRIRWEADTRLLPGVKSTLRRLSSAGIPLAIVSNSEYPGHVLRERLERMGLQDMLTAVVSSRDLGRIKPDPICYQTALKALNVPADLAAFVGDDPDELAGARRLGLQTIAFNPTYEPDSDITLTRFADLLELVDLPISQNRAG